ncbi:aminodeoxychorismate synthase, component I [Vagococcus penaei]|uniref:Aminodeoxychorismate synthase, component I n=1 Tax=Vagococcus penaei TaxID=633807 RepID=A0A1Q2D481_9ENTE|nr:aminodeoxychorismate synthase component I [Vagococcus penaei]AQP53169.1 aminodeoxychorismate synthase, component I [Vagococcus penaei]RSU00971.1 aminodeoxychorismate synthase, component I [Vagococcus penaei]
MLNTVRLDFENELFDFKEPIAVLSAKTLNDVSTLFNQLTDYQEQGYYIAGFVSYEAASAFNPNLKTHQSLSDFPLALFGIYADKTCPDPQQLTSNDSPFFFEKDTDFTNYQQKIKRIHNEIKDGNTYQTNYTIRLNSQVFTDYDGLSVYHDLLKHSAVKYSSFFDLDNHQILSASPELFFKVTNQTIETRPMKGTVRRDSNPEIDQKNQQFLAADEKNRSENIMIVDLLRNDLGQIAQPGSVSVTKLCTIEPYPTVWQMTSTIKASITPTTTILDLFKALFPCGSITGAPKKTTMDLITELEDSPRGVYCGAIGVIKPNGDMIFSVPIRTIQVDKKAQTARYGVGGGITWESTAHDEFDEISAKANVLSTIFPQIKLIESLRLENGTLKRLEKHLDRLESSAKQFNFPFNREKTRSQWLKAIKPYQDGLFKFRCELSSDGNKVTEVLPLTSDTTIKTAHLAKKAVSKTILLAHKTSYRHLYTVHQEKPMVETILWQADGRLTELMTGNLVVQLEGVLYTPRLNHHILPGVMRQELLAQQKIVEKDLTVDDLNQAEALYLINSVREWVPIQLITNDDSL